MKKILSIDGGGIRGIIPALVLAEIEIRSGRRIAESFDLIAGTSTGGILALALSCPGDDGKPRFSASEVVDMYRARGKEIFSRSLWRGISSTGGLTNESYGHDGLERVLKDYLGDETFGRAVTDVVITSYDIGNRRPFFFKSWNKKFTSVPMREVARATSAAPTFFEPARVQVGQFTHSLIDGGVYINNPAASAYAEAKLLYPEETQFLVVSLGSGELTRPIDYEEAKDWGKVGWLGPLLSCMFDGSSDAVDYQLTQLIGSNYIRFQTRLELGNDDMDDATGGNIANLATEACRLIEERALEFNLVTNALAQEIAA